MRATARVSGGWVGVHFTVSDQKKGTSKADSPQSPLPRSQCAQPSSPGLSGRALVPFRMQISCALLSPSYPGSGRTDAGRRGGSRTQSPAAARTSMKAHYAAKPDPPASSAWSADPRSACPSPNRPLERPSVGFGALSAASYPN